MPRSNQTSSSEIAYIRSPIGALKLEISTAGIRRLSRVKSKTGRKNSPIRDVKIARIKRNAEKDLNEYWAGKKTSLRNLPIDYSDLTSFQVRVLKKLRTVSHGQHVSYKKLAELVGSPRAARAVGTVMRVNPVPIIVPCHRVLKNNGEIGEFALGASLKKQLLKLESGEGEW